MDEIVPGVIQWLMLVFVAITGTISFRTLPRPRRAEFV